MTLLDKSITSDKDYLKILFSNATLINANGTPDADSTFPADPNAPFGFASSATLTHDLSSVPLVRAFWDPDKNGRWYNTFSSIDKGGFFGTLDPWLKVIVTNTTAKFIMNTNGSAKTAIPVYYRVYDFNNRAIDSDSLVDKIFRKDASSGVVAASPGSMDLRQTILTIPHGLSDEVPLWSLEFSNTADGPWYPEGTQIVGPPDTGSGPPGGPYARYYYLTAFGSADDTNFYAHLQSNYPSTKTVYVRFALDYRT